MGHPWYGAAIEAFAKSQPDAPAIVSPAGTLTFAGLHRAIERTALELTQRGLVPGLPVALVLETRVIDLLLMFACHRLGVPAVILGTDDPPAIARGLVEAGGIRVAVSGGARVPDGLGIPTIMLERLPTAPAAAVLPAPPDAEAACYLVRSSGTTGGIPKLVVTTHGHDAARVETTLRRLPLGPGERYLAIIGFQFGLGRSWAERSLLHGAAVAVPPALATVDALKAAAASLGATWTTMTPVHLKHLLAAAPADAPLLPDLRILVGSAPLEPADRLAVMRRVSPDIYVVYATNEVGALTLAVPEEIRRNPATAGRPDPVIEMQVVDHLEHPCPAGAVGTVRFRSAQFPQAYHRTVAGAASRFEGGWFYPGDAGLINAEGELELRGRVDDLISIGGQKVYPGDIEQHLSAHPAVAEAAAFGVPHRIQGHAALAAVVLRAPVATDELLAHCRATLGAARSPGRILVVEALPRTAVGKIDRRALRRLVAARRSTLGRSGRADD